MLLHDAPFIPPGLGRSRRAITSTSAVTTADQGIVIDATSGTYDVTTGSAASSFGSGFSFGIYNSGSGTVTFNPNGAETVRGPSGTATTFALLQGQGAFFQTDGTNWEVIGGIGTTIAPTTPVVVYDNAFTIKDETDPTKTLVFSLGGQSAGADLIVASVQTADRTATIPALGGAANFVMREAALTDNAVVRADGTTGLIQNSAVIIDDSNNVSGIGTLGASGVVTLTNTTASTSTSTGAVIIGNGTTGGLGVGGKINCTTFKSFITSTAYVELAALSGINATLAIGDSAGNYRGIGFATGSSRRWLWYCTNAAESGSNAGSGIELWAYDDSNAAIDQPISIVRAAGGAITWGRPTTQATNWSQTGATTFSTGTGAFTHNGSVTIVSGKTLTHNDATLHRTATALTNGAGALTGTLTNSPATGNPTKWIPIDDNGTTRYIPAW